MSSYSQMNEIKFKKLVTFLSEKGLTISAMESCTGGGFMNSLTNIEGASSVAKAGYVTYSNEEKIRRGVPSEIIQKYSVYSAECAKAMADACKKESGADISIGITGNFSNVDPQNQESSMPGRVFFCISMPNEYIEKTASVPIKDDKGQPLQRKDQKDIILYNVVRQLEGKTQNFSKMPDQKSVNEHSF
ncbi:MAG: CinA family protein [Ignavibacteriales bacterium]